MTMNFAQENDKKYVLIDTDAGVDDAHAILMTLAAHKDPNINLTVIGIVCVNGNTKLDNVCRNVTRILNLVELNDIPIFRGSDHPIVFPYVHPSQDYYHGFDGLGDYFTEPISPKIDKENGVSAIVRLAHEYKGKLTILALGPLTNLAMAVRLDPSIKECVKNIYAMGGNIEGKGNITVSGEFNFVVDPEAAYITLASYTCPMYIVPLEVCMTQGSCPIDWRVEEFGKIKSPISNFMNNIEDNLIKRIKNGKGKGGEKIWIPCDQLAAATLINYDVVKTSVEYHCTVELQGKHTRGLMIVDNYGILEQKENVIVIAEVNVEFLRKIMLWGIGGPLFKN